MNPIVTANSERYQDFNLRAFWTAAYRVCDDRQWMILEARSIHDRTFVDIAAELGLSERHVRRLWNEAMDITLKRYAEDNPEVLK